MTLTVIPVTGIGEIVPGDDLPAIVLDAATASGITLIDGDVVVVTHKVVSKAEGRLVAAPTDEDYRAVALAEATEVLRRRGSMIIAVTRHGFVCANAGVDRSNVPGDAVVLLPVDPDRSAHTLRVRWERATGARLAVVVSDTFGRPWRRGLTDVAIGISGIDPILDLKGAPDATGRVLEVTEIAVVDEIAAAADLVMGKARGIPVAVVRGLEWVRGDGRAVDMVRPAAEDFFR
ncbi:MAG: coenzyme F420-0:L-glutamate ligase [Acidimicrobiia bacterium]